MVLNYCDNCGEPLEPEYNVCPNCGKRLNGESGPQFGTKTPNRRTMEEGETIGWAVLGFVFPLVGFILFLVWQSDNPKAASSAGKGALIGFIIQSVFGSFWVT